MRLVRSAYGEVGLRGALARHGLGACLSVPEDRPQNLDTRRHVCYTKISETIYLNVVLRERQSQRKLGTQSRGSTLGRHWASQYDCQAAEEASAACAPPRFVPAERARVFVGATP